MQGFAPQQMQMSMQGFAPQQLQMNGQQMVRHVGTRVCAAHRNYRKVLSL